MNYFTEDEKKSREIWDTAVEYRDKDKIEKEKKEKESISLLNLKIVKCVIHQLNYHVNMMVIILCVIYIEIRMIELKTILKNNTKKT